LLINYILKINMHFRKNEGQECKTGPLWGWVPVENKKVNREDEEG
jgi:hypothetical protein